jgi:tripartite-type tricarboxylate transporter receptor subunit TctC
MTLIKTAAAALLACGLGAVTPAHADADFWRGKTMSMIVPTAPGGGYDAYARLLARHMARHLPGAPTIVARNMPGAGGIVAANFMFNVAEKDGTVIALADRAIPTVPLLYGDSTKAQFDALRFNWLGSMAREAGMGVVATNAPATTLEEMRKREVYFGATGLEQDPAMYARLFNALLGTRIKVIPGFKNQPAQFLAVERGELHGLFISGFSGSARRHVEGQIAKGAMTTFVQFTAKKDPAFPSPGVFDVVTAPADRAIVDVLLSRLALGRPFMAPPGVPAERVVALRAAFDKAVADPELLAEAAKSNLLIDVIPGAEMKKMIEDLYKLPADVLERTRAIARVSAS